MSVLRMLSPARGVSPRPSSSRSPDPIPSLILHVPAYGALFMNPPEDLGATTREEDQLRADQILNGELEVHMPFGSGRRRCKSIRVGLRSTARLDLGPSRMNEEDVIFERKVEIAGSSEGLWLDEGTQRFEFTLILPGNLAPHDWHVNGKISHDLYAEIEGVADPAAPSSSGGLFSFRSRPSQSRTRSGEKTSRSRSRAGSPRTGSPITSNRSSFTNLNGLGQVSQPIIRPNGSATNLVAVAAALSLNGTGHGHGDGNGNGADGMPQTPSYEQSEADAGEKIADDSWLRGFFEVKRALMLFYNPNPSGGTTDLAERQSGFAATVGPWHLEMISDVLSICALLQAKFELPSLSPLVSVYSFRIMLSQTHTLISPRDEPTVKPSSSTRVFTVIEKGKRPPQTHQYPDKHYPAIWRGTDAGGKDVGPLNIEGKGRLPDDDSARPTTLPYVVTPIRVSHALHAEMYFSVWGEEATGKPMKIPGPGGLRVMTIKRPLVLPSCAFIPQTLDLPSYDDHAEFRVSAPNRPETLCPRHHCPLIPSASTPEFSDFCNKTARGLGPGVTHDTRSNTDQNPANASTSSSTNQNRNPLYDTFLPPSSLTEKWAQRGILPSSQIQAMQMARDPRRSENSSSNKSSLYGTSSSLTTTSTEEYVCPLCLFYKDMPAGPFGRGTCACGVGIEQMEERMKRFADQERQARGQDEGVIYDQKVKAERERGRERGRQM